MIQILQVFFFFMFMNCKSKNIAWSHFNPTYLLFHMEIELHSLAQIITANVSLKFCYTVITASVAGKSVWGHGQVLHL